MPDNFAVGRVKERHAVAIPVSCSLEGALRVTLGLLQDVLRIYRHLLGFDDAEQFPAHEQTVIGGARRRWQLFDGVAVERSEVEAVPVADDLPGRVHRTQPTVDSLFAGLPLRFSHNVCNKPPFSQFARSSEANLFSYFPVSIVSGWEDSVTLNQARPIHQIVDSGNSTGRPVGIAVPGDASGRASRRRRNGRLEQSGGRIK